MHLLCGKYNNNKMEEPKYLDTVEDVRNRPDKSILAIETMCPEKLLCPDVAFPEQVKHLWLNVSFDICDWNSMEKWLLNVDCKCNAIDACDKCSWDGKYTDTLCKDLVSFTNLETLVVDNLNLNDDLWTKFAENSKSLKEIKFETSLGLNLFNFNDKEVGFESVFKIPTLEKVSFINVMLPFFPKGPSNIKHIVFDNIKLDFDDQNKVECESYYSNFHTHTNIVSIEYNNYRIYCPFKISCLRLEEMKQLEHITFYGCLVDQNDITSLKEILNLPRLKYLDVCLDNATKCLKFEGTVCPPGKQRDAPLVRGSIDETDKLNSFKSQVEDTHL
jgi:hypothetical protein